MIDLKNYIDSGIIEAYCLGVLPEAEAAELVALSEQYPEIREEIERSIQVVEQIPAQIPVRDGLKTRVLDFLDPFLAEIDVDLQNVPMIGPHSDARAWQKALHGLEPEIADSGFAARVLKETPEVLLSVVWLSSDLIEEAHERDAFQESFFILEGACECNFEGVIVRFEAGDYFEIPPGTRHVIRNISTDLPYVKGIVQRRLTG